MFTRRGFIQNGALAALGTTLLPSAHGRAAFAEPGKRGGKRLVVLFQRGAADGLNLVIPHGDPLYYSMRPSIAIPARTVIKLDEYFGLHPAMSALKPLWDTKQLAVVHAVGSPHRTRCHFDAQDYMESGMPGVEGAKDGWLNRAVAADARATPSPARAFALCAALPMTLSGSAPALAIRDFAEYSLGTAASPQAIRAYTRRSFAYKLRQIARLLKSDLGLEVAFTDMGGWDHHTDEGSSEGQLANLAREFSQALAAFWADLGALREDTVVVTMSEFGRSIRENGMRGTDHGHANVMLVLGGPVKGGRVYGRWPGLDERHLYEGRDLEVTSDFRTVLSEVITNHLGVKETASVFPHFASTMRLGLI
jgi:uncharacterized protein (DUF1501 family)